MNTPLGYWILDNAYLFRYIGELTCMREKAGSILLSGTPSVFLSGTLRAMYPDAQITAVTDDGASLACSLEEDSRVRTVQEAFQSYEGNGYDIAISALAINTLDTRELTPYLFSLHDALVSGGNLFLSFASTDKLSPFPKKLVDAWYAMDEKIWMKRYMPEDVLMALSMIGFSVRAIEKDSNPDLGDVTSIHAVKQ